MARTVQQIYDAMAVEKSTMSNLGALQPNIDTFQSLLTDLTTPSKVGKWRLMLYLVALGIWTLEKLWDSFKVVLQAIADKAITGNLQWYRDQALLFQNGYSLTYINGKYQYTTIDANAQIIKRAAAVESSGNTKLIIKVAKLVANVVTPLSAGELSSFGYYMNQVKFAGTKITVLSNNADYLKLAYTVYYDPLVLSANGSLISNPSVFPVQDSINDYISNLPFNGELVLTSLTDAAQKAEGVKNPILTTAEAKYGSFPYAAIPVKYIADAGHLIIDPAYPLSTQITYLPNV